MIMPRHAPPGAYVDDPAEKLDCPANEQPSVFTLASHGMTRIKEWAARGKAKQRALRHDLVTLSLCPEMLPCKHPSAAWCAREHGVSRQWASRLAPLPRTQRGEVGAIAMPENAHEGLLLAAARADLAAALRAFGHPIVDSPSRRRRWRGSLPTSSSSR